jgi:hypothetical protein
MKLRSLDDILDLDKLDFPPYPKVEAIEWYASTDHVGEPSYYITVILPDDTPEEHRERKLTREIEQRIKRAIRDAGIEEFAYTRTATPADLKWAEENRDY